jgi:hypothetical protein
MRIVERSASRLMPHPLSHAVFGQLPEEQFNDLKDDILERGLKYPLELAPEGRVICGSQRLRAIQALVEEGHGELDSQRCVLREELEDEADVRIHLLRDNVLRRQLSPGQMYRAAIELEKIYAERAERNRTANLPTTPNGSDEPVGRSAAQAAKDVGTSRSGLDRLKTVYQSDEKDLIDKVEKGQLSISAAAHEVSQRSQATKAKPVEEGARSYLLKSIKFKQEVERFISYLERHARPDYGPNAPDCEAVIDTLVARIDQWREDGSQ